MDYLQPQTFGSILRNSFGVYFRHWPTIVVTGGIVLLPAVLLKLYLDYATHGWILGFVLQTALGNFATLPLTVAVSDICIGLKPSVERSYQRALRNPGRVLGTYLMYALLTAVSLLALVVPSFFVSAFYMFVGPVVILEQLGGKAAFTRSRQLARGYYLRNLGVYMIVIMIMLVLLLVAGASMGMTVAMVHGSLFTVQLIAALLGILLAPLMSVPLILLYYDMRARKEDYGSPQLMEDLKY